MRWTPWSFFGGGGGDESSRLGALTQNEEWRVGGWGLSSNFFRMTVILFIKTHFYGGALTSHFMEEHSSPTSISPVFMMTSSNGNMFRVTGFCAVNSPVTVGNSPVTGEFPSHRPVTRSFNVFFDLHLNKRLSKQSRRRWFETPSLSLWRPGFYTKGRPLVKSNLICPSDKLSWQPGCPVLNINIQGNFCISQGNGSSDNLPENLV